jgi:hypothetical protein
VTTFVLTLFAATTAWPALQMGRALSGLVARTAWLLGCDLPVPRNSVPATRVATPTASRTLTLLLLIRFLPSCRIG